MQQMNFYCRAYCLLNMFRGTIMPIIRSSRVLYHLYNTLELLMMGIMVPETCWASNKLCNKNSSVASSWQFISTYYRRCTVKTTSNIFTVFGYTLSVQAVRFTPALCMSSKPYVLNQTAHLSFTILQKIFKKQKPQNK